MESKAAATSVPRRGGGCCEWPPVSPPLPAAPSTLDVASASSVPRRACGTFADAALASVASRVAFHAVSRLASDSEGRAILATVAGVVGACQAVKYWRGRHATGEEWAAPAHHFFDLPCCQAPLQTASLALSAVPDWRCTHTSPPPTCPYHRPRFQPLCPCPRCRSGWQLSRQCCQSPGGQRRADAGCQARLLSCRHQPAQPAAGHAPHPGWPRCRRLAGHRLPRAVQASPSTVCAQRPPLLLLALLLLLVAVGGPWSAPSVNSSSCVACCAARRWRWCP